MTSKRSIPVFAILVASVFVYGCTKQQTPQEASSPAVQVQAPAKGQSTVIDGESDANALQVAMSLDDFSTLVVAVQTAGIEDSLVNVGPLTVFAPVNAAFEKLPEGTVETLLKPENKGQLTTVLINHVAPSNYPIETLEKNAAKGRKLFMASGNYLDVESKDETISVGGTPILKSVKVSNGWIHVIDNVLVP